MINRILLSTIIILFVSNNLIFSQLSNKWSDEELRTANTVKAITYLNQTEKEAIIVLNLARLYPQKFVKLELNNYTGTPKYVDYFKGSKYKKSLIKTMKNLKPMNPLIPDSAMYENAKCFAIEAGKRGVIGHQRLTCEKLNFAECCSYGMNTGKEIIMHLLIDHDVLSLGHRKICLDPNYTKIGIGDAFHKQWDTCCVLELI